MVLACCSFAFSMLGEHVDPPDRGTVIFSRFLCHFGENAGEDCFTSTVRFDDMEEFNAPLVVHNYPGAVSRARQCMTLWNSPRRFFRMALDAALTEFIADLANYLDGMRHQPRSVIAARIADYIEVHIAERLTCSRIAEAFSYHPSYINRIIREYHGCSLHDYIMRKKIDTATKLLLESDMSVTDIAYYLSFYDSSHFSKTYCELIGCKPSEMRPNRA